MVWDKGSADGSEGPDAGEPDRQTVAKPGASKEAPAFDDTTDETFVRPQNLKPPQRQPGPAATPLPDDGNPYAARHATPRDPIVIQTGEFLPVSSGTFGILPSPVAARGRVAAGGSSDTVAESTVIREGPGNSTVDEVDAFGGATQVAEALAPEPNDADVAGGHPLNRRRATHASEYERTEMVDPSNLTPDGLIRAGDAPGSDLDVDERTVMVDGPSFGAGPFSTDTDPTEQRLAQAPLPAEEFDVRTDEQALPPALATAMQASFELGESFKRGGMAELFKAQRPTATGARMTFVVKKLLPHLTTDAVAIERFKREAELTMAFDHPVIVRTFEHGPYEDSWYIGMEWVDGPDLDELINRLNTKGSQCPPAVALNIAMQVAGALDYAHNLPADEQLGGQIIHRDVNPANVIVAWDGRVKLLDFGLAKGSESANLTAADMVVGKLTYQPPEALAGASSNPQFDVYGLAMLLYELLAGHSAFGGMWNIATIVDRIRSEVPEPLVEGVDGITQQLSDIVARAMAKEPADRYPTMAALLKDLREAARHYAADDVPLAEFLAELFDREVVHPSAAPAWPADVPRVERTEIGVPLPDGPGGAAPHFPSTAQAAPSAPPRKRRGPRLRRVSRRPAWLAPVVFLILVIGAIGALSIVFWDELSARAGAALGGGGGPQEVRLSHVEEIPLEHADSLSTVLPETVVPQAVDVPVVPAPLPESPPVVEEPDEDPMSVEDGGEPEIPDEVMSPTANTGLVQLRCRKGTVFVDKKKRGVCPKVKMALNPGVHRIEVRGPRPVRRKITVRAGQIQKLDLTQ